jgi:hypothetical protein
MCRETRNVSTRVLAIVALMRHIGRCLLGVLERSLRATLVVRTENEVILKVLRFTIFLVCYRR